MGMATPEDTDDFWLYDLSVETVVGDRTAVCRHVEGERFRVEGETLVFEEGQRISMYALAALIPLLPAKQRATDPHDWMTTDSEVACPDPHCGGRFRISRLERRRFSLSGTSGRPDRRGMPYWKTETGAE